MKDVSHVIDVALITYITHVYNMLKKNTVDSRYLKFQGTVWNTLRYSYLDISDLQKWGKNNSINYTKQIYM